ncbi:hypothetical protein [Pseudomonas guariconensis]|uniref:hypothetical protein n=1 Tax=Pseudomonas guariconensis TaxID=1288410 RepID=UPI003905AE7F
MSEENKSALGTILEKIKSGAGNIGRKADSTKDDRTSNLEPVIGDAPDLLEAQDAGQSGRPLIDELNDPMEPDLNDAPEAEKTAKKPMSVGRKLALFVIALVALKLGMDGVGLDPFASDPAPAVTEDKQPIQTGPGNENVEDLGLTAGLPNPLADSPPLDPAIGKSLEELKLSGPFQEPLANHQTADASPADPFGFPAAETPEAPAQFEIAGDRTQSPAADMPSAPAAAAATTDNPFSQLQSSTDKPKPTPIESAEKESPILGSAISQKSDSSSQQLAAADGSALTQKQMQDEIRAQGVEIEKLKRSVSELQRKQPAAAQSKPSNRNQRPANTAVRRPTPQRTVAATKVAKRPKVCVKAVAPPARNCASCVAHAFVVGPGGETMVGQGDFLAGYRVAITGDRLDLQDSAGQVVHKFWSQPNGCTSI